MRQAANLRVVKIGLLSDTHDQFFSAKDAVRLLQQAGAQHLIHCGDVGSIRILDTLVGTPAAFVFGNTDYDRDELRNYAALLDIECLGVYGVLELAGKRIAVTHGDDHRLVARLTRPEQPIDYLLTGHTHVKHDRRVGSIRLINPGALYRAASKTVATLDLETDELVFLTAPEP
jgi:putative phosphoesterase